MMSRHLIKAGLAGLLILVSVSAAQEKLQAPQAAQGVGAKTYRTISPDNLERILKGMGIDFQKKQVGKDVNHILYSFTRNNRQVVLHDYAGKELVLIAAFDAIPLTGINQWNRSVRFGRAVLNQEESGDNSTLEAGLDLSGGVSEESIVHFVHRFTQELTRYASHVGGFLVQEEETFKAASPEYLEKLLADAKITYKKGTGKDA